MILGVVETSGESPDLALEEVRGAAEALGGSLGPDRLGLIPLVPVSLPSPQALIGLAARLALARRTLIEVEAGRTAVDVAASEGHAGRAASFRRLGRPTAAADPSVRATGAAYVRTGGCIDLDRPAVRYWLSRNSDGSDALFREVAGVDRRAFSARAMPRLPFRRPVSLPPRLARAAMNLAALRPGDRLLDPFLGTGALLAEGAMLGARCYGVDADPTMVRGALRNFAHLGLSAEAVVEGDARLVSFEGGPSTFDALVTDPPYGRSSASVGAEPGRLVPEVLERWTETLRAGARVVVLSPGGPPTLVPPWRETARVPVRVHRSLTREFRVYRRPD
jgi:putative methyltransferase (TIGR01177 family)